MVHMNIPLMPEMGLIPHQLGLARPQIGKLMRGMPIQISHAQMGSGAGDIVMMLHPHNAKKLLTGYKKGKGVRISMSPEEIHHSINHGRGFVSFAKKAVKSVGKFAKQALKNPVVREVAKKGVHYGADVLGTAVGTYLGNPAAGAMIGEAVGSAAEHAIDERNVRAGAKHLKGSAKSKGKELAYDAIEAQVKKLPYDYRGVAQSAIHSVMDADGDGVPNDMYGYGVRPVRREPCMTGLGARPPKGSPEMKAYMAKIRGMRKGGNIFKDISRGVSKATKGVSKAFTHTFTPQLGRELLGDLKVAGHYAIPAITGALGGIAGTALTGNPVGGVAGSALGSYAGNELDKKLGIGVKRGRGRPRKGCGASASMSKPYKQALALNKMTYGLSLNNSTGDNAPISKFHIDPRVRPSSTEMTLSPYASMSSPAMNPFIPTTYQQQGGVSSGYGEAVAHSNIYGQGVRRRGRPPKGAGLYGGNVGAGLYGGNAGAGLYGGNVGAGLYGGNAGAGLY